MAASTPAQVKALGRKVKNFDEKLWCERRFDIVYEGNMAKYRKYPELQAKLLATGNKILVEAANYDKIWGIGLSSSDSRAQNKKTWQGQNLLGQILMKVRDNLSSKSCNQ